MGEGGVVSIYWKQFIAWSGAIVGSITLSKAVLCATLVYTSLQIYLLMRDKIFNKDSRDEVK